MSDQPVPGGPQAPRSCAHCHAASAAHIYRPVLSEDGWSCGHCGAHLGYRPDLDEAMAAHKVRGLLLDLCAAKFLSVSNNTEAEGVVELVRRGCQARGAYDQYTILQLLVEAVGRERHAAYWRAQALAWTPPWERPGPSAAAEMRAAGAASLPGF